MKWTHKSLHVATTLNSLLYFFQRVCHFSKCVLRETNKLINLLTSCNVQHCVRADRLEVKGMMGKDRGVKMKRQNLLKLKNADWKETRVKLTTYRTEPISQQPVRTKRASEGAHGQKTLRWLTRKKSHSNQATTVQFLTPDYLINHRALIVNEMIIILDCL